MVVLPVVIQASITDTKNQPYNTWAFNSVNRSFPEQGCYHLLSCLLPTDDPTTFIGNMQDAAGTPILADHFLFPGNIKVAIPGASPPAIPPSAVSTSNTTQSYLAALSPRYLH